MALDKVTLKNSIKQAFLDELGGGSTTAQQTAVDNIATKLSNAIDVFVKSGTVSVTVATGIPVATAGTAAAQTGATTAPGTGTGTVS